MKLFGLMTKAEHERLMNLEAAKLNLSEFMRDHNAHTARSHAQTIANLAAEIDALTPLAKVGKARLATLERAKAKRERVS